TFSSDHRVYFNGVNGELEAFGSATPMDVDGAGGLLLGNPNVVPLDLDGNGHINLLHMPRQKSYSTYEPVETSTGWVWRRNAVQTASGLSPKIDFTGQGTDTKVV